MESLSEWAEKVIRLLKMLSYKARASVPSAGRSVGGKSSDYFPVPVLGGWGHRIRLQSPSLAEEKRLIVLQDGGT